MTKTTFKTGITHKEHEQKVRDRLEVKVRNSMDQNEPLFCIGHHHIPDIIFKRANFTKPVYFSECEMLRIRMKIDAGPSGLIPIKVL